MDHFIFEYMTGTNYVEAYLIKFIQNRTKLFVFVFFHNIEVNSFLAIL